VHGVRCYDNIVANAKCQQVLVLAVCLVQLSVCWQDDSKCYRWILDEICALGRLLNREEFYSLGLFYRTIDSDGQCKALFM